MFKSMTLAVKSMLCAKKKLSRQGKFEGPLKVVYFPEEINKLAGDIAFDVNVNDVGIQMPEIPDDIAVLLLEQLFPAAAVPAQ